MTLFILHGRHEEKNADVQLCFFLPPASSHFYSPLQLKPLDTWRQPHCIASSIASPEQRFSHVYFLFPSLGIIIPSALFSPIRLYHFSIWAIGTLLWLGLRGELKLHRSFEYQIIRLNVHTVFNHNHTRTLKKFIPITVHKNTKLRYECMDNIHDEHPCFPENYS